MHIIFYKSTPVLSSLLVPFLEEYVSGSFVTFCVVFMVKVVYRSGLANIILTYLFVSNVGVFQGDVLSTNLFILLMTYLPI